MNWTNLWLRLRALFGRRAADRDLRDEVDFHIQMETRKNRLRGAGEAEARRQALLKFGSISRFEEECRDERRVHFLENIVRDFRYTLRMMRRSPGFTTVALTSLALGIGANAAIFTLMNAVFLKSLPVRDPSSLLLLGDARSQGVAASISGSVSAFSWDLYKHLRDANILESLAAFQSSDNTQASIRRAGWSSASPAVVKLVSGNYFDVLGVNAAIGRTILPSDDSTSAPATAVVSYRYWKEKLDGNLSAVGSTIDINEKPVSIIGVAPEGFFGDTLKPDPPSFWRPVSSLETGGAPANRIDAGLVNNPDQHWLYLVGRLKSGDSITQAQVRLTAALQNWMLSREGSNVSADMLQIIKGTYVRLTHAGGGIGHMRRDYFATLWLLLGISALVLLITCANIANLILARGTARRAEGSVRHALGASRWRLVQQSLTESLTLAIAGGTLGLLVASTGARLLINLFFGGANYVPIQTEPDVRVLVFTLVVSSLSALIFGVLPAIRVSSDVAMTIRGTSASIKSSALSRRNFGLGRTVIMAQVPLAIVGLAGSGSFTRSLGNLSGQRFGFDPANVLIVDVDPVVAGYKDDRLASLYDRIFSRLNAISGVSSASMSLYSPFKGCCWSFSIAVEGFTPKENEDDGAMLNRVSPRYFETIGTRVLQGRSFDEHDTPTSRAVAVVNEAFVRLYIPDGKPIGKHFGIGDKSTRGDLEIVGVVDNAKYDRPREAVRPMAFLPLLQLKPGPGSINTGQYGSNFINAIEVRSTGNRTALAVEVRRVLAEIDPALVLFNMNTVSDNVRQALRQELVIASLAMFFGLLGLVLACVGLYGLTAYMIQRRTGEIGIRLALGADRGNVIGMVIRDALAQGIAGVLIGIPAAFIAVRLVASHLFGVGPTDLQDSVLAAGVLLLCIAIAAFLPAYRASRVDPAIALKYE